MTKLVSVEGMTCRCWKVLGPFTSYRQTPPPALQADINGLYIFRWRTLHIHKLPRTRNKGASWPLAFSGPRSNRLVEHNASTRPTSPSRPHCTAETNTSQDPFTLFHQDSAPRSLTFTSDWRAHPPKHDQGCPPLKKHDHFCIAGRGYLLLSFLGNDGRKARHPVRRLADLQRRLWRPG